MVADMKSTGEESKMSVRVIVTDDRKVLERELSVTSFDAIPPGMVKPLGDQLIKSLVGDVNGWRSSPDAKGQMRIVGTEDV